VRDLADLYPDSVHVTAVGLAGASDDAVWQYAARHGHLLVTKDEDFLRRSVLEGPPPKVVWIRLGNCPTAAIAALLRERRADIARFVEHEEATFLALG
jgi:predicted nuclease of predicted toxin-antitoxin system